MAPQGIAIGELDPTADVSASLDSPVTDDIDALANQMNLSDVVLLNDPDVDQ